MALPGLNTQGTQIRVLPEYTPSRTALDLSALGSGISQGMQLVGQAQEARRLRDIIAEEQATAPLREARRLRELELARAPIKSLAGIETKIGPNGDLLEVQNIEAFIPGGEPYKYQLPTRVIETAAQRESRIDAPKGFAPDVKYMKNETGGTDAVYLDRNPGREGMELRRVKNVIAPQSYMPPEPKPDFVDAGIETLPGPGGNPFLVQTVKQLSSGKRFYVDATGNMTPFTPAPKPSTGGDDWMNKFRQMYGIDSEGSATAPQGMPGIVAPAATAVAPATQTQQPVVKVIDPAKVYLTR